MIESVQIIDPVGGLERLSEGLAEYKRVSGKSAAQVLVLKGGQLLFGNRNPKFGATFSGLVRLFMDQAPRPGVITAAAKARGFRFGRISEEAEKRAAFWMGGFKSILAHPSEFGGRISLGAIRVGKTGRRIVGGRKGRGGAGVSGDVFGPLQSGEVRLNRHAVATLMEINVREGGRGYLGSSWLFKRWRRLAKADPRREDGLFRTLENMNPRSRVSPLGDAALTGDIDAGNCTLRITSHVPGVEEIGTGRGIFTRAIALVTADLETYLARKQGEMLAELILGDSRKAFAA